MRNTVPLKSPSIMEYNVDTLPSTLPTASTNLLNHVIKLTEFALFSILAGISQVIFDEIDTIGFLGGSY